jgi:Uma2 family endonuclease
MKSFGETHEIDIQNPVVLSKHSEPEPDAMVVRRPVSDALMEKPTAADVFLLVEVSDTTLSFDRDEKLPLYAEAGIPEVWVIDVNREILTQYHTPRNGVYTRSAVYQRGDTIMTTLGVEVIADDILLSP